MIQKTVCVFRRTRKSWRGSKFRKDEAHIEGYRRSTWWLFGFIPLYSSDVLVENNI